MGTRTDIANRALQHCGARRIPANSLFTDTSVNATEIAACYEQIRQSELNSNVWRYAIRRVILRALDTTTKLVVFPAWATGNSYFVGSIVSSGGLLWTSVIPDKVAVFTVTAPATPAVFSLTAHGFVVGTPLTFSTTGALPTGLLPNMIYYVITAGLTANAFEVSATNGGSAVNTTGSQSGVHTLTAGMNTGNTPSDDTGTLWTRYFGPLTALPYDSTLAYWTGELLFDTNNVLYMSLISGNTDTPPTANWRTLIGATLTPPNIQYPLGAGPLSQMITRNVFYLPSGFLGKAPDNPRAGDYSILGMPSNQPMRDWLIENQFITSRDAGPIVLRFNANVADTSLFAPLYAEALSASIATQVVERLTQSTAKLQSIEVVYKEAVGRARIQNGIETGSTQPPLDDFLMVRF